MFTLVLNSTHAVPNVRTHLFDPPRVGDVERILYAAAVRRHDQQHQEHPEEQFKKAVSDIP